MADTGHQAAGPYPMPPAFARGRAAPYLPTLDAATRFGMGGSISPDAHAVAWAAGPGIHDRDEVLEGAARMITTAELGRRAWRALAIISCAGWTATTAALAVVIWG